MWQFYLFWVNELWLLCSSYSLWLEIKWWPLWTKQCPLQEFQKRASLPTPVECRNFHLPMSLTLFNNLQKSSKGKIQEQKFLPLPRINPWCEVKKDNYLCTWATLRHSRRVTMVHMHAIQQLPVDISSNLLGGPQMYHVFGNILNLENSILN